MNDGFMTSVSDLRKAENENGKRQMMNGVMKWMLANRGSMTPPGRDSLIAWMNAEMEKPSDSHS